LLSFLDERVQYDDAPSEHEAVERPADAGTTSGPQLEQAISECA
jgi:hypothetical protein